MKFRATPLSHSSSLIHPISLSSLLSSSESSSTTFSSSTTIHPYQRQYLFPSTLAMFHPPPHLQDPGESSQPCSPALISISFNLFFWVCSFQINVSRTFFHPVSVFRPKCQNFSKSCVTQTDLDKNGSIWPSPSVVIAIFTVRPIIFSVCCMFVPTTNKQSPQKETGSESTIHTAECGQFHKVQNWYELTYNFLRSLESKISNFCVNFLPCNTYLEFMRNNKFVITIVFGKTLPFPSIFQSGEFVKQLVYCFHFLNGKFYCYTKLMENPEKIHLHQELVRWFSQKYCRLKNNKFWEWFRMGKADAKSSILHQLCRPGNLRNRQAAKNNSESKLIYFS